MKNILILIICIVFLYFLDFFMTKIYVIIQLKKDERYGMLTSDKRQYSIDDVHSLRFPKRQIKALFHLYKGWIRYKLRRLGNFPAHWYRDFILRYEYNMKIAKNAVLYGGFEIRAPWKISIGAGSVIGDECKLDGRNGIVIGENVNLSTGVWIWTEQHDLNDPNFNSNTKGGQVQIRDRAWVSSRSTLLPGITIGEGAVVAAGAVVTKSIDDFAVVGGVPAKIIGKRNNDLRYVFRGDHEAFF